MPGGLSLALGALFALLLTGFPAAVSAQEDEAGSRDPYGVERYPRSWIVAYELDDEVRPRDFIMSRVDRIRRRLVVEERLPVEGRLESATYRIPEGASVEDVVSHYREVLGGEVLFSCDGRGCGRSADWAHQIFEQSVLYGPDRNQRYLTFEWREGLVTLYAIERGNQRVYAHLRFIEPRGVVGLQPNALLARRLSERGWAIVEGVEPKEDGTLTAAEGDVLSELTGRLQGMGRAAIYVVCHLYGTDSAEDLLAASRRCAENAAALMGGSGSGEEPGTGPALIPFGAGPLSPRSSRPRSRLELVSPEAFSADDR